MGISEKLNYLVETKNQIKSALNTPYNVFRDYATLISKYVKNQPKSIVEGSTAICENAIDLPCNIDINGNSYQETTEGYNKLPYPYANTTKTINGITFTDNGDGTITANGTATANASFSLLGTNGSQKEIPKGFLSGGINNGAVVRALNSSSAGYTNLGSSNGTDTELNLSTYTNGYVEIVVFNGTTVNNVVFKPMIAETSGKPWEPYTNGVATPNTNHKQDIEVIEAYNKIKSDELISKKVSEVATTNQATSLKFTEHSIKAGIEYTFKLALDNVDFTSTQFLLAFRNSSNVSVKTILPNKTATFTEDEIASISYMFLYYNNADNLGDKIITKLMLVESKYADKPQMKYNCIGLVQRGKNLYSNISSDVHIQNNDINYELIDNNTLKIFTTKSTAWGFLQFKKSGFKKGQKYKFSCEFTNSNSSIKNSYVLFRGANTGTTYFSSTVTSGQEVEFTPDDTVIYVRFNATQATAMENTTVYSKIQISTIGGEFEPYIEPILKPINLQGNSIAKVGDVKDLLNIRVDGRVKANKNIFIEKLTSSNNIVVSSFGTNCYNITFPNRALFDEARTLVMSTHFKGIPFKDRTQGIKDSIYVSSNEIIVIRDTSFTTIEELKTFLDNNDVYIMYVLNTPETIELPSIEPITMIEGITNVFELVTNLGTTMKVEYIVNAEALQNEITELSNAVIELGGTL